MLSLFDPIRLGDLDCPNRVFMAPLTRGRGTKDNAPTQIMAAYYAQRASAGLIISEAIGVSQQGLGWPYATGIWRQDQIDGWKMVTNAVHAAGGRIIAQIWHMGRMVHPRFNNGATPVSASATRAPGRAHTYEGRDAYATARPLSAEDIAGKIRNDYVTAARNAMLAGFDGVQIHAANGYLIDQFLRNNANFRTDQYGGPIENRIRLLRELTQAVINEVGAKRTCVRLSPNGDSQGVNDSQPEPLFAEAAHMLSKLEIAFLEIRESPRDGTLFKADHDPIAPAIRRNFTGPLVLNSDLTAERAQHHLDTGLADAVSFGRAFIANPDLPNRLKCGIALASYEKADLYARGAEGYTDFPNAS